MALHRIFHNWGCTGTARAPVVCADFLSSNATSVVRLSLRFRLGVWWPALNSGIWVVDDWSFHTIRFWPTSYASSITSRISLRIHHKSIVTYHDIKRKLYFP